MWIKARNGNVVEVDDGFVAGLVAQGHESFQTEAEARGVPAPKRAVKRPASKS